MFCISCSRLFNKDPDQPKPLSPQLDFQQQCLADVTGVMNRFVQSTATPAEVKATWNCFADGIGVFEKKVQGRTEQSFDAREVASFFEKYFLKNLTITDEMLQQIMNLKMVLVGGNNQQLSKAELLKLQAFAREMGDVAVDILPYVRVYTMTWEQGASGSFESDVDYFEKASAQLLLTTGILTKHFSDSGGAYDLRNVIPLFTNLQTVFQAQWSWLPSLKNILPFVTQLKGVLTGTDLNQIQSQEWNQIGVVAAHGYIEFLRFNYFGHAKAHNESAPIVYFANSMRSLFNFLGDIVSSKPTKELTKAELVRLVTSLNNVFPNLNFTENLVNQFMQIKIVFFGGSSEKWVPEDFVKAQAKVDLYSSLLPRIWKYGKFYGQSWDPTVLPEDQAQAYFQDGELNLNQVVQQLSASLENSYDLQNITLLANALDDLITTPSDKFAWASELRSAVPVIIGLKKIILSDDSTVVDPTEWTPLLGSVADLYHRYLYYNYFLTERPILKGPGLESLDNFAAQVQNSLTTILMRQPDSNKFKDDPDTHFLSYDKMDNVLGQVLPQTQKAHVDLALKALFGKILVDPTARLGGYQSPGFNLASLKFAYGEYLNWSLQQHQVSVLFQNPSLRLPLKTVYQFYAGNSNVPGFDEMSSVLSGTPALVMTDKGDRIQFSSTSPGFDFAAVSRANLSRELTRLVFGGYIQSLDRYKNGSGIVIAEANAAYFDFQPLLVDLGFIKSTDTTFISSRFFETSLFTPTADGNTSLKLREVAQEISILLSGLNLQGAANAMIGDSCIVKKADASLDDILDVTCGLGIILDHADSLFGQMPEALSDLKALPRNRQMTEMLQYLRTAGWADHGDFTASRSDLNLVSYVVQYAEVVMQRYDLNHDGRLNFSEAKQAYPNFAPLISSVSHIGIDIVNKAVFYYMLRTGVVPCGFQDVVGDLAKVLANEEIKFSDSREDLGKVLGSIGLAVKGQKPNCKPAKSGDSDSLAPPEGSDWAEKL
jgi:hypothetical protein